MPVLTPSERRGALVLLALCALGACWDLFHASPVPAPTASGIPGGPAAGLSREATATPAPAPPQAALDLNRATAEQLDRLPGIGPVLASRIVEHRQGAGPFRSTEELLAVRGIGGKLLEKLRTRVTVLPEAASAAAETMQIAMPPRR